MHLSASLVNLNHLHRRATRLRDGMASARVPERAPRRSGRRAAAVILGACILAGAVGATRAESRGELLYATHCIACHTTQVHWRDKKLATDWNSLKLQVRRWQAVAALEWSEEDVLDVTRHLNERFYGFTPASNALGMLMPAVDDGRGRIGLGDSKACATSIPREMAMRQGACRATPAP